MLLLFQFIFNTELFRSTQLQITCVLKKLIFYLELERLSRPNRILMKYVKLFAKALSH